MANAKHAEVSSGPTDKHVKITLTDEEGHTISACLRANGLIRSIRTFANVEMKEIFSDNYRL